VVVSYISSQKSEHIVVADVIAVDDRVGDTGCSLDDFVLGRWLVHTDVFVCYGDSRYCWVLLQN
jgi:hypothetical protein